MLNQEGVFRLLLNGPGNRLPVLRSKYQGPQNQQIAAPAKGQLVFVRPFGSASDRSICARASEVNGFCQSHSPMVSLVREVQSAP